MNRSCKFPSFTAAAGTPTDVSVSLIRSPRTLIALQDLSDPNDFGCCLDVDTPLRRDRLIGGCTGPASGDDVCRLHKHAHAGLAGVYVGGYEVPDLPNPRVRADGVRHECAHAHGRVLREHAPTLKGRQRARAES